MNFDIIKTECNKILESLGDSLQSEIIEQRIAKILYLVEQEEEKKFYMPDAIDIFERVHKEEITFDDTYNKINELITDFKYTSKRLEELNESFVEECNLCPKCGCKLQCVLYTENIEYQGSIVAQEFADYICDLHGIQGRDF